MPIRSSPPSRPRARKKPSASSPGPGWAACAAHVLASLAIPYQIPLIMFVSERGTLGEFNYGQSLVCRTMRPVLDSLAMEHHTATRLDEFEFIVDRSIKQAITTQAPVALILSPLLTGGKVFDK
jgi:sulfopyruvate decarboxylase TPP-binding subunit